MRSIGVWMCECDIRYVNLPVFLKSGVIISRQYRILKTSEHYLSLGAGIVGPATEPVTCVVGGPRAI